MSAVPRQMFYLNGVGYKASSEMVALIFPSTSFYLNGVGYKDPILPYKLRHHHVLSERSGI